MRETLFFRKPFEQASKRLPESARRPGVAWARPPSGPSIPAEFFAQRFQFGDRLEVLRPARGALDSNERVEVQAERLQRATPPQN